MGWVGALVLRGISARISPLAASCISTSRREASWGALRSSNLAAACHSTWAQDWCLSWEHSQHHGFFLPFHWGAVCQDLRLSQQAQGILLLLHFLSVAGWAQQPQPPVEAATPTTGMSASDGLKSGDDDATGDFALSFRVEFRNRVQLHRSHGWHCHIMRYGAKYLKYYDIMLVRHVKIRTMCHIISCHVSYHQIICCWSFCTCLCSRFFDIHILFWTLEPELRLNSFGLYHSPSRKVSHSFAIYDSHDHFMTDCSSKSN